MSALGELIGISKKGGQIVTSYNYEGDQRIEKITKIFKLNSKETGIFRIRINITDLNSSKSVIKSTKLTIVE